MGHNSKANNKEINKEDNQASMYKELADILTEKRLSKQGLAKLKIRLCTKHKVKKIPTDIQILLNTSKDKLSKVRRSTYSKPTRTGSGVAVVAIMAQPRKCPHGACTMCPSMTTLGIPQSYTGKEPATMRAIRNKFDPYLQVMNRLEQYVVLGQSPEKVELIIMGGTFPSFPVRYQENFVKLAFRAMNDFSRLFYLKNKFDVEKFRDFFGLPGDVDDPKRVRRIHAKLRMLKEKAASSSLAREQKKNETSQIRCVGLTLETRSDYATLEHADHFLKLGCTRIELGVQTVYDDVLRRINRGHGTKENIESIKVLRDLGYKLNFHVMLGLPGVTKKMDVKAIKTLFEDPAYKPDMMKLYPCMVVEHSQLYKDYKAGRFKPISTKQAADIIVAAKPFVRRYCRIMRVQRDIPTYMTVAGVDKTNLRQYVYQEMQRREVTCNCIRCREPSRKLSSKNLSQNPQIRINIIEYEASDGREFFISYDDVKNDALLGFVRLRLPSSSLRKEITAKSALVRELHVYGTALALGEEYSDKSSQHRGIGKKLMAMAEKVAKQHAKDKIVVISGVGVRGYYKRLGYRKQGPYMIKKI